MSIKPQIAKRIRTIVQQEGRRPRILLAHLESDSPDRWTKPLAATLAEWGFDVDFGPPNQTPATIARLAIDNDVHLVCVSLRDTSNQPLVVELVEALQALQGTDIRLVAGGAGLQPNHTQFDHTGLDLIVNFDELNVNLMDRILDLFDANSS